MWGCSFILMKRALESFEYFSVGAARVFFGAVALGAIWHWQKRRWPLVKKDILPLVCVSLVGYAVPFSLQPYIVREVEQVAGHGSAFGGMLVSFVPLLTILVSIPLLGVYPTKRQLIGVIGGFGGIYALFAAELNHDVPLRLLLLGSVTPLCYALANTYVKRRFHDVPVMALAFSELAITAMMLAPLAGMFDTVDRNEALTMSVTCLLILGVLCTGVATAMFYKLIQGHGPLFAGMVAYIIPCVAMGVGYLDGEKIVASQIGAIASIFVMVALVQYRSPGASAQALKPEIEP
jgi:drug/metabolite transporter (DMT)-like permease